MKTIKFFTVLTVFLMLFAVSGCKKEQPAQKSASSNFDQTASEITAELKQAPDFTLTDQNGKTHTLSDYRGKIVVLEWFNYECPFCKYHYETETTMVDMANDYATKNVVWLAINSTSHQENQKNIDYAKAHNIPFAILVDKDGKVGRLYNAQRTPEMFIIDAQGKIVYHGASDNAPLGKLQEGQTQKINYVKNALDELLAGKPITLPKTVPYGCTVKYAK